MLLDCTLRDGGYHNNWKFSQEILDDLIKFHLRYNDIAFEYGYLSLETQYPQIIWPNNKKVFAMINSKDGFTDKIIQKIIDSNFFNGLRIATNIIHLYDVLDFIKKTRRNNIFTVLNLMRVSELSTANIDMVIDNLKKLDKNERPNVFCLADSYGSLLVKDTQHIMKSFSVVKDLDIELGFHAHNDKGLALANTLEAISGGASWYDGCWLGMGRRSGNAELEDLIKKTGHEVDPIEMQNILEHFAHLRKKYDW